MAPLRTNIVCDHQERNAVKVNIAPINKFKSADFQILKRYSTKPSKFLNPEEN